MAGCCRPLLGRTPLEVMAELGTRIPSFALAIYAWAMRRDEGEGERVRALVEGVDWAPVGTSAESDTTSDAHAIDPDAGNPH